MLDDVKGQLAAIEAQVASMYTTMADIRPGKGELRWFAERRTNLSRARVHQGAKDALNHAAAMLGYFDGYEVRGAFQRRTGELSKANAVRTLDELLDYVSWVLSEILDVVRDLQHRESLEMCSTGPKKPGPMRTATVCKTHLLSLEKEVCAVILDVATNQELRARIHRYLES